MSAHMSGKKRSAITPSIVKVAQNIFLRIGIIIAREARAEASEFLPRRTVGHDQVRGAI